MNKTLKRLLDKCAENGRPIDEIIVEIVNEEKNKKSISIIACWLGRQSASDSLDLLLFYLDSVSLSSEIDEMDSIFLYENKVEFDLRKPIGFRKIGVFH